MGSRIKELSLEDLSQGTFLGWSSREVSSRGLPPVSDMGGVHVCSKPFLPWECPVSGLVRERGHMDFRRADRPCGVAVRGQRGSETTTEGTVRKGSLSL